MGLLSYIKGRIRAFQEWADEAEDECSGPDVDPSFPKDFKFVRVPREGQGHFAIIRVKEGCPLCQERKESHALHAKA